MVLLSSQRDEERGYESRSDSTKIVDTWLVNCREMFLWTDTTIIRHVLTKSTLIGGAAGSRLPQRRV